MVQAEGFEPPLMLFTIWVHENRGHGYLASAKVNSLIQRVERQGFDLISPTLWLAALPICLCLRNSEG